MTKLNLKKIGYVLISGTNSEVSGRFSATANIKTENANKTVIPRAIFSPESGVKLTSHISRLMNNAVN
jgi:hypothetical protein